MQRKQTALSSATELRDVEFRLVTDPGLRVAVAGSFNGWDARSHPMREDGVDGAYRLVVPLPPGEHEYRFVVGDDWLTDPENPNKVANCFGTVNSVVVV